MTKELEMQKNYLGQQRLETIYFGGGTPSLLTESELHSIFEVIHQNYQVSKDAEITLEANPDDLDPKTLSLFQKNGINRLSIGIQSFHDSVLRFFNRAHNATQATESVLRAREAGFANISIDLIYGVPGEDMEAWKDSVAQAIELKPEHLSSYSLTIEEKTAFGKWFKTGRITPMDEDRVAEQFEYLMDALPAAGFDHYEISNFARPGFYSKHNSSYWKGTYYLGVGPGAHSYDGTSRQYNVANNAEYTRKVNSAILPFEREVLTSADKINELILTGLRTSWGCDLERLKTDLGYDLQKVSGSYVQQLIGTGVATLLGGRLILTNRGKLLADKLASDLFVSAE